MAMKIDITLETTDDWTVFSEANSDALLEIYPNLDAAMKAACDGGIQMGGGAAPEFFIHFAG
jgi:hypothetical protein